MYLIFFVFFLSLIFGIFGVYLIFSRKDRVLRAYGLSVRMAMATRRGEAMCCLINACGDGSAMGGTARLHRMALCLCIGTVRIFLFVFEGGVERGGGLCEIGRFFISLIVVIFVSSVTI